MRTFQLPKSNTIQAKLLTRLLNGEKVTNMNAKDALQTANPATIMSQIRAKGWNELIIRKRFRQESASGYSANYTEYWIDRKILIELKCDPRIVAFMRSCHRYSDI